MSGGSKVRALIHGGRCNAQAYLMERAAEAGPEDAILLMRRDDEGRAVISYANLTPEGALMLATLARDEAVRWEREDGP